MTLFRSLTLADIRNVNRDSLLRLILVCPWIMALLLRWVLPFMAEGFVERFDFRVYYGLLTSFFSIMLMPQLFGYIAGFMLLDERDDGTLQALRVTPLSMERYLVYKMAVPVLMGVVAVYIFVPVVGLITVPYAPLLPIALVAALTGPIFALLLASLAANKVQGLAVMKGLSLVLIAPMVAYFVPTPWQWLFALAPTFWPLKAFWQLLADEPWWPTVLWGLVVNGTILLLLLRHFMRNLGRQSW
jgi:fluoroquinolone transport system permease protein